MDFTSPDLNNLNISRNNDGTYTGTKEVNIYSETTGVTYKSFLEYPRLHIKWENNIEFGIVEDIIVMPTSAINTTGSDDTLLSLTVPDNNIYSCKDCNNLCPFIKDGKGNCFFDLREVNVETDWCEHFKLEK